MNMQAHMADTAPSCLRLERQPVQFNSQNIPPHHQILDIPRELQPYVPSMAVLVGNEVARMSQINPAFTFLMNVITAERYDGQLWHRMVQFSVMSLWANTINSRGASIDSMMQEAAGTTVVMKASHLAAGNQIIMSKLDTGTQREVIDLAQKHDAMTHAYGGMIAQLARDMAMAANPAAMAASIGGLAGVAMTGVAAKPAPNANPYGSPVSTAAATINSTPVNTVAGLSLLKPLGAPPVKKSLDYYGQIEQRSASVQQAPLAPTVNTGFGTVTHMKPNAPVTTTAVQAPVKASEESWKPIQGQYYKPAYNYNTTKLVFEQQSVKNQGQVTLAMVQLKDDNEMNEAEHQIPTLNRSMRDALAARFEKPATDVMVRDLDLVVAASSTTKVMESPEQTERLRKIGITGKDGISDAGEVASLDELIVGARCARLTAGSDTSVFLSSGLVHWSNIVSNDLANKFSDLVGVPTIAHAVNVLNKLLDEASDPDTIAAVGRMVSYLTQEVNYVLAIKMGLKNVSITNINEDLEALLAGLRDDFGMTYYNAFVGHQKSMLGALFAQEVISVVEIQTTREVSDTSDGAEEGATKNEVEVIGYEYVTQRDVGLALLHMDSTEFGLNIPNGEAFELFGTNFPGLQPFVKNCMTNVSSAGRMYIVTLDDVIFGVDSSILGDRPVVIYRLS